MAEDIDRAAIAQKLVELNEAKRAHEQQRSNETQGIYFAAFDWFVLRRISICLIDDCFVLGASTADHAVQGGFPEHREDDKHNM